MDLDPLFAAPIGAVLICLLRILDVSMAIMRMILAVRGHRVIAAFIGFFEVLIWLIAVGTALEHLNSVIHVIGYAGGFAIGNYVGVWLEARFALGVNVVRAVIRRPEGASKAPRAVKATDRLRREGYAVTELEGRGQRSFVDILDVIVRRRSVPHVIRIIRDEDPAAFLSVEEVRAIQGGYVRPGGRKLPFVTSMAEPFLRRRRGGAGKPAEVAQLSDEELRATAEALARELEHLADESRLPARIEK